MRVSVVIPTHNRPEGLKRALNSIYNQTLKPDEIIIIDDASMVDIESEVIDYIKKDNGISIVYSRLEKNSGACFARNYGVKKSTGDIIMFLDDDDTWESNKVYSQIKIFRENPTADLVYTGKLVVNEDDRDIVIRKIKPLASGYLFPDILYKNLIGTTSCIAIKKSTFSGVGGFDEELPALQDIDLYIRICKNGAFIKHDNNFNMKYTIAPNPSKQISGSGLKQISAVKTLLFKYHNDIENQGFIGSRKVKSSFYYAISKALHKNNYYKSLIYTFKSVFNYPSLRAIYLLLPSSIILKKI